jgi:diacylglycerol kinase (ATP)
MMRVQCVAHGRMIGRHQLAALVEREGIPIHWTTGPRQMQHLAETALADGCQRLLVAGGDGSLQEAAQALIGTDAELAVIPGGTGNDYARSVGASTDLEQAVQQALLGEARKVDVGLARTMVDGAEQQRYFVNIAEVGFGAGVVARMNHFARYAGKGLAYPIGILTGVVKLRHHRVRLIADGVEHSVDRLVNLVIANGKYFGRGMMPAPDAELDDGLFDVLVIQNLGRWAITRRFPELKHGPPPNDPDMRQFRCRRLEVQVDGILSEADGEVLGHSPAVFEVCAKKLRVILPPTVSS